MHPKRFQRPLLLSAVLALAAAGGDALARDNLSRLPDAVRAAERNGQILKAEEMRRGDEQVPRVKVLTPDGRVRVLRDAPPAPAVARNMPRAGERALPPRPTRPQRDDGYGRED